MPGIWVWVRDRFLVSGLVVHLGMEQGMDGIRNGVKLI